MGRRTDELAVTLARTIKRRGAAVWFRPSSGVGSRGRRLCGQHLADLHRHRRRCRVRHEGCHRVGGGARPRGGAAVVGDGGLPRRVPPIVGRRGSRVRPPAPPQRRRVARSDRPNCGPRRGPTPTRWPSGTAPNRAAGFTTTKAERAGLMDTLLYGRVVDECSVWAPPGFCAYPVAGPNVVVAAEADAVDGRRCLRSSPNCAAWMCFRRGGCFPICRWASCTSGITSASAMCWH